MKKLLLIFLLMLPFLAGLAQQKFQMRYGSLYYDRPRKIIQTYDDNFIVAGETEGFGSDKNAFLMKIDSAGNILWLKDYAGINYDIAWDILELSNHHLIICGGTYSFGQGGADGYVMETDENGTVLWTKVYGTIQWEEFYKICHDDSGGYFIAGYAHGTNGQEGTAILHIDSTGNLLWSQWVEAWYAEGDWWPIDLIHVSSGGCLLEGWGNAASISCWRFSQSGNLMWSSRYGRTSGNQSLGSLGLQVEQNKEGQFFLFTTIIDSLTMAHATDLGLIKLDSLGNLLWVKSYGGIYNELDRSISATRDSGLILCGYTNSSGNGDYDHCLIKITKDGMVQWAKSYGTVWLEKSFDAIQCNDNGYILCGQTWSSGTTIEDSSKINVIKTDSLGNSSCNSISWNPVMVNHPIFITSAVVPENLNLIVGVDIDWTVNDRSFYQKNNCSTIGINEPLFSNGIEIFPIPSNGNFEVKAGDEIESVTIYDIAGRECLYKETILDLKIWSIDLSNSENGVYFLKVQAKNGGTSVNKFIIR